LNFPFLKKNFTVEISGGNTCINKFAENTFSDILGVEISTVVESSTAVEIST